MVRVLSYACAALWLSACGREATAPTAPPVATAAEAEAFIQEVNDWRKANNPRIGAAFWVGATYIARPAMSSAPSVSSASRG
jgi:peptidyl-dipeptidase A